MSWGFKTEAEAAQHTSYCLIPPSTLSSLVRFRDEGVPTGDFLRAFLSNDLMGALGRADGRNIRCMREIGMFVRMEMPAGCHGSRDKVNEWIRVRGLEGIAASSEE